MKNIFKKGLLIAISSLLVSALGAQTTVTWVPTQADVTTLTNKSVAVITVGTGTQSFKIYAIRPLTGSTSDIKLLWDASANAIKMNDNGMDKAGIAIYVPNTSDNISNIVVYMHTSNSRKTLYASGNPCPSSGTVTTSALAKTPTAYTFWTGPFSKDTYYAFGGRSGGSGDAFYDKVEVTFAGSTTPVAVTGVTLDKTTATLDVNGTEQLTATVLPANADDKTVSWSTSDATVATVSQTGLVTAVGAGTATITVTTNDGNKKATCTVTVTAPATPIPVTSIALNKTSSTLYVGATETLTVTYTPADANTGKGITWSTNNSSVASVANGVVTGVAVGTAVITATTENNKTATCNITVEAAPVIPVSSVTLNKTTTSIQVGKTETLTVSVEPSNATDPSVNWTTSNSAVASVANGVVTGVAAGEATITVTSNSTPGKSATCTVTVTAGPPVPHTDLALHMPDIYEARMKDGGYAAKMSEIAGRLYEVYYTGRMDDGGTKLTIHTTPADKSQGITKNETNTSFEAVDGWFKGTGTDKGTGFAALDEFQMATQRCHTMTSSNSYELHVQGFDQFSIYAMDKKLDKNPANNKYFKVAIDGEDQQMTISTSATIRRFEMTPSEHVIKITLVGDGNLLGGFSLREAQVPHTKWIKGNDSTQVLLQTTAPKTVLYYTKYNSIGETRLEWEGPAATGITLTSKSQSALGDTLKLGGVANCPVGNYTYKVVSYMNNVPTNSVTGKFSVYSSISAKTDTAISVRQNSTMKEIRFDYYALSANDVTLTWTGNTPTGISGSGENGIYTISGRPTVIGEYPFKVTVKDGNSITGKITVKSSDLGPNPVLFLCKKEDNANVDGIYLYLKNNGVNLDPQEALSSARSDADYAQYKWILISEDVDADNPEVLQVIKDRKLPILNMKGFTYAAGRLGWGEPDNGTISTQNGGKIFVQQNMHPIFSNFANKHPGDAITVLSNAEIKGVMPIAITKPAQSLCLATAYTRDINDYTADGEQQTIIHEVPAKAGEQKYICFPLAKNSQDLLTADGKKLLNNIVSYITGATQTTITPPELEITNFVIAAKTATIDQTNNTIVLKLSKEEYEELEPSLTAIKVTARLANELTHLIPSVEETVDLQYTTFMPKTFVVTDYINRRAYNFSIVTYDPQGIDETYTAGQWVNIFDIYGRKITTTNEDIYTMELPKGIYLVVTESGKTIKIFK